MRMAGMRSNGNLLSERGACYTYFARSKRLVILLMIAVTLYIGYLSGYQNGIGTRTPSGFWISNSGRQIDSSPQKEIVDSKVAVLPAIPPRYIAQVDYRLTPEYWPEYYVYPQTDPSLRANACLVLLTREKDLVEVLKVLESFENRFNRKYRYPYVIFNDQEFSDSFKTRITEFVSSSVTWAKVGPELWNEPDFIDMAKANASMKEMHEQKVMYGGSLPYRKMCRFFSGMIFKHPAIQKYDYYWRLDGGGVGFHCDIDFDPFVYMQQHGKEYGFTIALHEYPNTIPTLWDTTMKYMKERGDSVPGSWMNFFTDNGESYNGHHFWSNFEIASVKFFAGEQYQDYFDYLDRAGGFFYERWGDAPVHTLGVGLFLRKDQVHFFNEIGYSHHPWTHCPAQPQMMAKCQCQANLLVDDIPFSCLYDFLHMPAKTMQANLEERDKALKQILKAIEMPKKPRCPVTMTSLEGGEYVVCLEPALATNCKMYSFLVKGAGPELKLELQALKRGCEVFLFDQYRQPKDMEQTISDYDHKESVFGLRWLQYTLSDIDSDMSRRDVGSHMAIHEIRLKSAMELLSHQNTVIDILKFDVEGNEGPVIMDMLESEALFQVKNLVFEIHIRSEKMWKNPQILVEVLQSLQRSNFELVYSSLNQFSLYEAFGSQRVPCCYKLSYRNKAFL